MSYYCHNGCGNMPGRVYDGKCYKCGKYLKEEYQDAWFKKIIKEKQIRLENNEHLE